ncbi:hypothetical protein EX30DRAFT_338181 [Ascodesmis nigricans]|uniref:Meiotic recombination protein DMC1 n=1 Tax=Ascodesmis nigricans TaxID=341454 RepID=A0A4V3SJD4_9PEZI|nr:hypothetical protein EX30DRAFT_338181 [Ascodesmis nigricans]
MATSTPDASPTVHDVNHPDQAPPQSAGGFLTSAPSSPGLSTVSPGTLQYRPLPKPHEQPLRSGSRQESNFIRYLDNDLLTISRKFAKQSLPGGYTTMAEPAADMEKLVDLLWISSTPWLQVQYLLNIANTFNDYLASFPPDWPPIFQLLDKLDRCFYDLVVGTSRGWKMSMTEKVRVKGIIERTRLHVVQRAELYRDEEQPPDIDDRHERMEREWGSGDDERNDSSFELDMDDGGEDDEDLDLQMEISRVYSRTMEEVGERLGG